ncbi:aminotransferase class IV [Coraliomargarita akajimensis]|nr:aminotransferase class IV [Coraliomargarita akajimensis]
MDTNTSAFAHGFGLFETIKLESGHLCFWPEHWNRLLGSASVLGIDCSYGADTVLEQVNELISSAGLLDGAIKLSLLREADDSRLLVYSRSLPEVPQMAELIFSREVPLNEHSVLAGHKTHNYMENLSLLEMARNEGYYDLLRSNTAGALAETTLANIFCIVKGVLHTPALEAGILPGVIREEVLRLAYGLGLSVTEDIYLDYILEDADAVFLTNSLIGLLPVRKIQGEGVVYMYRSQTNKTFKELKAALAKSERERSVEC